MNIFFEYEDDQIDLTGYHLAFVFTLALMAMCMKDCCKGDDEDEEYDEKGQKFNYIYIYKIDSIKKKVFCIYCNKRIHTNDRYQFKNCKHVYHRQCILNTIEKGEKCFICNKTNYCIFSY